MEKHECKQETRFTGIEKKVEKVDSIHTDVVLIKHTLLGDDGKNNGMVDNMKTLTDNQDMYGKAVAVALGIGVVVGWLSSNASAIAEAIGSFVQHGG